MLKKLKQTTLNGLKTSGVFSLVQKSQWRHDRLLILAYHGISLEDEHLWDPDLFMAPHNFRARLQTLKKFGCNVLPLNEALQRLYADELPENCVALTFDDGYYDFYQQAHPLLQEFNFPATLYLATYYVDCHQPMMESMYSYLLWKGRSATLNLQSLTGESEQFRLEDKTVREALRNRLLKFAERQQFTAEEQNELAAKLAHQLKIDYEELCAKRILHLLAPTEVQQLAAAGVDIQLHTHHHCSPLKEQPFRREIEENRSSIEGMTGNIATQFCYPGGIYSKAFFGWLEQMNVHAATTCEPGYATRRTNRYLLPRLVDHSLLSPIEFEGWLAGVGASIPRRHRVYHPPLTVLE